MRGKMSACARGIIQDPREGARSKHDASLFGIGAGRAHSRKSKRHDGHDRRRTTSDRGVQKGRYGHPVLTEKPRGGKRQIPRTISIRETAAPVRGFVEHEVVFRHGIPARIFCTLSSDKSPLESL